MVLAQTWAGQPEKLVLVGGVFQVHPSGRFSFKVLGPTSSVWFRSLSVALTSDPQLHEKVGKSTGVTQLQALVPRVPGLPPEMVMVRLGGLITF